MQNIKINFRKLISMTVLPLLLIILFLINSCTDVIEPAKNKQRTLTIVAQVKDCNTGLPVKPAPNAKIRIFEVKSSSNVNLIDSVYTNSNGIATYINEGPVTGFTVKLIGEYNNQFVSTSPRADFLFCNDTTVALNFECTPPATVCCDELKDTAFSIVFNNGTDSKLVQNNPIGVRSYDADLTVLCNRLNCNPAFNYTITVPNPKAPFILKAIYVNGTLTMNPVTLKPGDCLSLAFSASTENIGVFTDIVPVSVTCNGKTSTWAVNLNAEVIPENCACPVTSDTTLVFRANNPDKVPVGINQDYQFVIFQNMKSCILTVEQFNRVKNGISTPATQPGEWTLISPSLPTELDQGDVYTTTMRFRPSAVDERRDSFRVVVRRSDGQVCNYNLIFSGYGCIDACPLINGQSFDPNKPISVSAEAAFSPDASCPQLVNIVNIARMPINITLPKSSCNSPLKLNVRVTGRDQYDAPRFSYNSVLYVDTINPTNPEIVFTAPTVVEYNSIFTQNGGTRTKGSPVTKEDSAYHVTVEFYTDDGKCRQIVNATGYATPAGKISIPWLMDAYNQTTSTKPTPDYQACKVDTLLYFAGVDRPGFVYQLRDELYQPYCGAGNPQACWGTFYINVDNPTGEGNGGNPKNPELYLVNNTNNAFTNIRLLRTAYSEESFDRVDAIVSELQTDVKNLGTGTVFPTGAATQPYTHPNGLGGLAPGNVYLIYSGNNTVNGVPCQIALIYIRQVINQSGLTTNNRSSITFRIIYPIYITN